VTITRVQVQAKTAPAGCTTNAIVRLTDGTTPVNVTISAAANGSGAISQNYAAGASLQVLRANGRSGLYHQPRRRQRHRPVPHAIRLGEGKRYDLRRRSSELKQRKSGRRATEWTSVILLADA